MERIKRATSAFHHPPKPEKRLPLQNPNLKNTKPSPSLFPHLCQWTTPNCTTKTAPSLTWGSLRCPGARIWPSTSLARPASRIFVAVSSLRRRGAARRARCGAARLAGGSGWGGENVTRSTAPARKVRFFLGCPPAKGVFFGDAQRILAENGWHLLGQTDPTCQNVVPTKTLWLGSCLGVVTASDGKHEASESPA